MKRLFELFDYQPLNVGNDKLNDRLIPYYFKPQEAAGSYLLYNNRCLRAQDASTMDDPFRAKQYLDTPLASAYIKAGYDKIMSDAVDPFANLLLKDLETDSQEGWLHLMKYDSYSTRSYLAHVYRPSADFLKKNPGFPDQSLPSDVINWMETRNTSSGSYDKAFSESVLDAIAFGKVGPQPVDWKCLE